MKTDVQQHDIWVQCPSGTLQEFAKHHRRRANVARLTKTVGTLAVLCIGIGLTWQSLNRRTGEMDYHFGGITCSSVRENLREYAMGSLPDDQSQRIRLHLEECPHCQALMQEMRPQVNRATLGPTDIAVVLNGEQHFPVINDSRACLRSEQPSTLMREASFALTQSGAY